MKNYKLSKEEQEVLKAFKSLKSTHDDDSNFAAEEQIAMQAAESFTKKSV